MNEFVEQFLLEARELVEQATEDLLALEITPADKERLDSAFRAFHTLKGAAGIVDFDAMARALHAAEDVLARVRTGEAPITTALIGDGLTCLDQVVQWLDRMQVDGEPPANAEAAADAIVALFSAGVAHTPPAVEAAGPDSLPSPSSELSEHADGAMPAAARALLEAQLGLLAEPTQDGKPGRDAAAGRVAANVLHHLRRHADAESVGRSIDLASVIRAILGEPSGEAPATPTVSPVVAAQEARALRVDVERIDALVKLVGELSVLKNALGHAASLARDGGDPLVLASTLKDQHARLERLTDALQQSVLGIRVLPLRHVFLRFSKLVRDMAAAAGKSVRLLTEGETTEADKAIVEALFEPLLHMVRNAVDHGVETASEREAAGKPPVATIRLRGVRDGDQVLIDIEDDGRGIDIDRVRRIAAERGAASLETISTMSDEEAAELIFAPGFSTAPEVTSLSGRGVGMDAVRTSIRRLGGTVSLSNRPGRGVRVRVALPFTVMMTRLMTVEAGGEMFGLPMDMVVETVKVARDRIAPLGSMRAIVLRERTVPVLDLTEALGEPRAAPSKADAILVVVAAEGHLAALEVDRLGERIDVMLKPMDGLLAGMPGMAGTTLLGDGRVLIVLDLVALLR